MFMKFLWLFLSIVTVFTGCIPKKTGEKPDSVISVTATIFPLFDFTREIAGDRIHLNLLLMPAAESHSYEPTPKDIITVQKSDIFIYIGGESDSWVDRILDSMNTHSMKIIRLMDCVQTVEEEIVEGMEAETEEEPAYDEHIWTSPKNTALIIQEITETLCETDPENAAFYQHNAAEYLMKLDALDSSFQTIVDNAKRKTIVFGDRFPLRYFADTYGLSYFAAFPGCSTETEPSAATVAFLINKVKAEEIPVIFHIELSNEKMADTIAEATGAKKLLFHVCHNITKKDFENGQTYMKLMQNNVTNLREALY
ncbi:periplasmic divalent manganese/zinc-binding lipoprotein [Spirochaetia bacterium]|nr:periplasmic divalent manganese/zinc-binding lipoprotein [Spirochaetia bacterium]GHU30367.1 periplasmic divalent manganese/zinc-binding lipoprotein [Spirochaetia bacterium]